MGRKALVSSKVTPPRPHPGPRGIRTGNHFPGCSLLAHKHRAGDILFAFERKVRIDEPLARAQGDLHSKAPLPELQWDQQAQPVLPKHQRVLETRPKSWRLGSWPPANAAPHHRDNVPRSPRLPVLPDAFQKREAEMDRRQPKLPGSAGDPHKASGEGHNGLCSRRRMRGWTEKKWGWKRAKDLAEASPWRQDE